MALIECPECKKNVSDMASSCPDCGYPIKSTLMKARASDNILKAKERVTDSMRVSCKICGYEAGSINLTAGVCNNCLQKERSNREPLTTYNKEDYKQIGIFLIFTAIVITAVYLFVQ
jgi:predicted amidophosphoribosyltransferase